MSRVGKHPVAIPSNVQIDLKEDSISVKGPRGSLTSDVVRFVKAEVVDGQLVTNPFSEESDDRAKWGMARNIVANMVEGVVNGFSQTIEIVGVGFRVAAEGKNMLRFALGFSHDIVFALPEGVEAKVEKPTILVISGNDKQKVGQVVGEIVRLRRRDPYKGKGLYRIAPKPEFRRSKEGKKK